jgi:regulator of sigma E protease
MDILFTSAVGLVQNFVSFVVPMVILLGLLIFVHELGHFLVAKYFNIKVEVFSLGFGPKILTHKRGDTVYAISAIPLGGYVKMFGDDPTAPIDPSERAVSFTHKPVAQRIAVVLAGPLMNLFFALVVFSGVAAIGESLIASRIGDVKETSAAFAAGFRSGDSVIAVNGESLSTWDNFIAKIEASPDQQLSVTLERAGQPITLEVTPKLAPNKNIMSWSRMVGELEGLTFQSRSTFVGIRGLNTPAGQAGLRTADQIKSVNGTSVGTWREFRSQVELAAQSGAALVIEAERGHFDDVSSQVSDTQSLKSIRVEIVPPADAMGKSGDEVFASLGIESPDLYLAGLEKNAPAAKAGLKQGDRLISIDGKPVNNFEEVVMLVRSFGERLPKESDASAAGPKPLDIVISRDGDERVFSIAPDLRDRMTPQGKEETRFEIGIRPLIVDAVPATIEAQAAGWGDAFSQGFQQTMRWTSLTVLSFVRLFQAEVSPKNIGGFLSIGQMAKRSWQIGPAQFLNIMGIISINLFILNLLPVPVLDGGHLLFFTIEAVKGAPLSVRKMEIAQQIGIVLLLFLMVFALFNDVTRTFLN